MKSIKPGRGPSGMSFMGSVFGIIFGIFWTILAASMTRGAGLVGIIFPLFGVMFVISGIVSAGYHYKNATGKNRYSAFDITDSAEEADPADSWIRRELADEARGRQAEDQPAPSDQGRYCPWCGAALDSGFRYCPKCGRELP